MDPQVAEALTRIGKRLDRLEARVHDDHHTKINAVDRLLRRLAHQSAKWERAADAVFDGGPSSLAQSAASNRLAIQQLTHDVSRLLVALEDTHKQRDSRAAMLGIVMALIIFDTMAILGLIIVHVLIYA